MSVNALKFASDATVRAILIALCEDESIRAKAFDYLGQLEPEAMSVTNPTNTTAQDKRKATSSRWSDCVRCGEHFDEADNDDDEACEYHTGESNYPSLMILTAHTIRLSPFPSLYPCPSSGIN
jgi:hypothetical protein